MKTSSDQSTAGVTRDGASCVGRRSIYVSAMASTQPRAGGGNRACFKCGKTGHWSKDCAAPRDEWIPQQPRGEETGVPSSPGDLNGDLSGLNGEAPATAQPPKKPSTRKPKFTTVEHVLGPNGVAYVSNVIPEKFARVSKGPGHEFGDFARLVGLYREWTRKMYPHATHDIVMRRVKALSKTKEVKMTVREFKERARMENGEVGVDEGDGDGNGDATIEGGEDVFFPDEDDDIEVNDDTAAFPDDEEQEWNDVRDGGDVNEDEELAILQEQERAGEDGAGEKTAAPDQDQTMAEAEAKSNAFDDARANGLDVNFDESSEDDDDFEIATRAWPAREKGTDAAPKGKARKKVKEPKRKQKAKKGSDKVAEETEPITETTQAPTTGRKKLGGGKKSKKNDGSDSESDVPDEEVRRPRRKVVAQMSDSDDDAPVPQTMGGDLLGGDVPVTDTKSSALYDSEGENEKKRKAEGEAGGEDE